MNTRRKLESLFIGKSNNLKYIMSATEKNICLHWGLQSLNTPKDEAL